VSRAAAAQPRKLIYNSVAGHPFVKEFDGVNNLFKKTLKKPCAD